MAEWLAHRSFGEMICLMLVAGMVVGGIVGAIRGRG